MRKPDCTLSLNDVHLRYAFTLDNGNCPPGYFDIMNKCLWLMCGVSSPTNAEYRCSRTFGTLASLDETGMTRLAKYLDHIKARSVGITQVSYLQSPIMSCRRTRFDNLFGFRTIISLQTMDSSILHATFSNRV